MPRARFVRDVLPHEVGPDDPEYKAGAEAELSDDSFARWERRGAVVDADDPNAEVPGADNYDRMKKAELIELAAERGLEVPDASTKAEFIAALREDDAGEE